jgi:hypothetical protein
MARAKASASAVRQCNLHIRNLYGRMRLATKLMNCLNHFGNTTAI